MQGKASVPAIRFAGFSGDWEQHEFSSIFDCTIPNNTFSRADLNYEEGTVRDVHYGDILTKFGSILDVNQIELPFITGKCEDDFKGSLLQDGDIILADTAEDETTGKGCEIANSKGSSVVSGLHTMVCRPKQKMVPGYLGYYINSDAYHHQLLPFMQGIKVLSLSRANVLKTYIRYPSAKKEQQQISTYFHHLDNLIVRCQNKYAQLCNVKKSMLEKMFPKEGATVPEIRFAGFTDDWEQRKLGECFSERIENMPKGELISVTINDGIKKFSELGRHDNSNEDKSKYKKVCVGDIAYNSMRMWQGASGYSPYEGIVSPAYTVLIPNPGISSKCLAYQFKLPSMIHTFQINSQGITSDNWNLKFPTLSEIEIFVSSDIKEQEQIAAFFTYLDNLITLHQHKLERLQNIKKSCLEKMFV